MFHFGSPSSSFTRVDDTLEGPWDVFFSWTRRDAPSDGGADPRTLVDLLRTQGLRVWVDDDHLDMFAPITASVRDGIARSKMLVAWYGPQYPNRRACREELTLALLASRTADGLPRIVGVLPDPTMIGVVESPLLDTKLANTNDLPAAARAIAARVATYTVPFGALTQPARPRFVGGEGWFDGSQRFVGRLTELWAIHDQLQPTSDQTGPGRAGRSVALVSGWGGAGKSLLATEYAHTFASQYPAGVIWLNAAGNTATGQQRDTGSNRAATDSEWTSVAVRLGVDVNGLNSDEIARGVHTVLAADARDWLWVVDDLPTGLSAIERDRWLCSEPNVWNLITTRDSDPDTNTVTVGELDPTAAVSLLVGDSPTPGRVKDAEAIVKALGGHALAVDVTARACERTGEPLAQVCQRLTSPDVLAETERLAGIVAAVGDLRGSHDTAVTATLAHSLNALPAAAAELVGLTGLVPPVPVSYTHLTLPTSDLV